MKGTLPSAGVVFLDRDGVINELVKYAGEWESPRQQDDVRPIAGAIEAIGELIDQGWRVAVVSNQPSYAKGKMSMDDVDAVHQAIVELLASRGLNQIPFYYCFHHPQAKVRGLRRACDCRKPKPGMLLKARRELGHPTGDYWMIGDQEVDILAGQAAGCRTVLLAYGPSANKRGNAVATLVCCSLSEAVRLIQEK